MSENFFKIGVQAELVMALETMGLTKPTPIQYKTIPQAITGQNIIGQSATGTGKTFAYLLPLLQKIDPDKGAVQAVVLAPTYELAMQIYHQAELLLQAAKLKISCASLIGGANIARQMEKLKKKPQIIVGSAGRICELQKKGKLKLADVRTLVCDEADKLLDDQNIAVVKQLIDVIDPAQCQYFLFSATIPQRTLKRAGFVTNPHIVSLKDELIMQPDIENLYFIAEFRDKIDVLRKLSKILAVNRGLVFVNKNDTVAATLKKLLFHDVKAVALNGDADKMERKKAIEDFTKGKVQLMVASDIAARGLDIADVDYVFNLDLPEDEKVYLHRVGRTGRAGKSGCAISLVDPREVTKLGEFAKKIKVKLQSKKMSNGVISDFFVKPKKQKPLEKIYNSSQNPGNLGKKRD